MQRDGLRAHRQRECGRNGGQEQPAFHLVSPSIECFYLTAMLFRRARVEPASPNAEKILPDNSRYRRFFDRQRQSRRGRWRCRWYFRGDPGLPQACVARRACGLLSIGIDGYRPERRLPLEDGLEKASAAVVVLHLFA